MQVRVERIVQEARGIKRFILSSINGTPLPSFKAGAHIDVSTPLGLVRQYSLCGHDTDGRYTICVLQDTSSRGGSASMHTDVAEGSTLDIGMPRNLFPLDITARHSALIAAGIGITPILCMVRQLHSDGASFELHYAGRTLKDMAFAEELLSSPYRDCVHLYFSDVPEPSPLRLPALLQGLHQRQTHLYACGPTSLMDEFKQQTQALGWPSAQVHHESFGPAQQQQHAAEDNVADFVVRIASTGWTIPIHRDQTLVDGLRDAGIDIPTSCEQGICGTCLTSVLEGICDHRDGFLLDSERKRNNQILPCVSRAKSSVLVLDL